MALALFRPRGLDHGIAKGKHPLRRASVFLGGVGAAYIVTSVVLAAAGAVPTAPVLIGLDPVNYHVWQALFIVPLIFTVWVLASGVILVLGKKGCRRSLLLAETAWAWGGPLLVAWVPALVQAAFMALGMGQEEWVALFSEPGPWQTGYLAFFAAAAALAVRDFILVARTVHKKSWPAAVLTGTAAAALAIGAFVLFVR